MLIGGVVVVCTDGGGLQGGGGELASDDGLHDGGELAGANSLSQKHPRALLCAARPAAACVAVGKANRCSSA
jgi:hypothetical protein